MVPLSTWFRYIVQKFQYSAVRGWTVRTSHVEVHYFFVKAKRGGLFSRTQNYDRGHITEKQFTDFVGKNVLQGRLTYQLRSKGEEMAPTITGQGGTLLVRKLPAAEPTHVFVGDVVVLKNPDNPNECLVRRLAAIEGYEMVSKDEQDTPFVLEKDQCWVLADNDAISPKEAHDSRSFGPVPMSDIIGRVIYSMRSAVDHGPVQNSSFGMQKDSPVLAVELDVDEMSRSSKS